MHTENPCNLFLLILIPVKAILNVLLLLFSTSAFHESFLVLSCHAIFCNCLSFLSTVESDQPLKPKVIFKITQSYVEVITNCPEGSNRQKWKKKFKTWKQRKIDASFRLFYLFSTIRFLQQKEVIVNYD